MEFNSKISNNSTQISAHTTSINSNASAIQSNSSVIQSNAANISSLQTSIGKALLYKGDCTDALQGTTGTGFWTFDGSTCANVPVAAGAGIVVSFGIGTILTYRLCFTSAEGVWYSVYIPSSTWGTWKRLAYE